MISEGKFTMEQYRKEINSIDEELVKLLERRFNVVLKIGQYKKENNLPIYDEKREKMVIENCVSILDNKNYSHNIEDVYNKIMETCKDLEK
jgi:monofunctional chorismate mutase